MTRTGSGRTFARSGFGPRSYLCSAAPPIFEIAGVVEEAQRRGWDVCLGLTPTAADWLEDSLPGPAALTGHPVRSRYKRPSHPDVWPPADAVLVAPATMNTINSWALGITGAWLVGFVAEAIGKGIPLTTMPCVNSAYAQHPQFPLSLEILRTSSTNSARATPARWPRPSSSTRWAPG
ncbi:flavoprotein [Streptomyces sp. NPDC050448]|uniref:flavoprotein n=1 Tax=Streptomyces sp. NPDC050448 TaxID=3155404 RepID=UPI003427116B